jgi:hypothetical protein
MMMHSHKVVNRITDIDQFRETVTPTCTTFYGLIITRELLKPFVHYCEQWALQSRVYRIKTNLQIAPLQSGSNPRAL